MVQNWAIGQNLPYTLWTPTDQTQIDALIEASNRTLRVIAGVQAAKYFVRFSEGNMSAVAPSNMPLTQYDADRWPGDNLSQFGFVIPVIVWVIVGGVALIGSLWGASEIIEAEAQRQEAKNKSALQAYDYQIAHEPKATQKAWSDFKNQNHAQLMDRAKTADGDQPGLFTKIFGSGFTKNLGSAIGIGAALLALFAFLRYAPPAPKKKKVINDNPCKGKKIKRQGPPVKWSKNQKKRAVQRERIAAYYEGQVSADQLRFYREQAEKSGWTVASVHTGKLDYEALAEELAATHGATAVKLMKCPFEKGVKCRSSQR